MIDKRWRQASWHVMFLGLAILLQARGGAVWIISCIEDPEMIQKILDRLKDKAEPNKTVALPESRAPTMSLFA